MKFTQVNTGTGLFILEKVSLDKSWIIGITKSYEVFWRDLDSFQEGCIQVCDIAKAKAVVRIIESYFSTLPHVVSWDLANTAIPSYRGNLVKQYLEFLELEADLMVESLVSNKGD
jgi:hypothetical protein